MADFKNVDGGDLMLFTDGKTLAFATSHKLSVNVETVENSSKDNGAGKWKSSVAKKMNWGITSDNLFLEKGNSTTKLLAFGDLFDKMILREPIDVVFTKHNSGDVDAIPEDGWAVSAAGTYSGKAIITSLEANAPNGDNATYTVSLEGVGALTHVAEA